MTFYSLLADVVDHFSFSLANGQNANTCFYFPRELSELTMMMMRGWGAFFRYLFFFAYLLKLWEKEKDAIILKL